MYSAYDSVKKTHLLEIDQFKSCLQITLTRNADGECIVGEFSLSEAEEIAAAVTGICRDARRGLGETAL